MTIIAIDPGQSTGLSWTQDGKSFNYRTLGPQDHHFALFDFLGENSGFPKATIICESFEYRPYQGHAELTSVEYIGIVKFFCERTGQEPVMQRSVDAVGTKSLIKDETLRQLGLWTPGNAHRHERAALKHLLFYLITAKKDSYWLKRLWEARGSVTAE